MSTVCVGLLVVFFCQEPKPQKPVVTSDFCQLTEDVRKFDKLTDAEIAALSRPRKEAILALREKRKRFCN